MFTRGARKETWVGTDGGGVNCFRKYRATLLSAQGVPSDSVRTISQDRKGDVWLGTTGGIARIRASGGISVYGEAHGLQTEASWPVLRDRTDRLWVGSEAGIVLSFPKEPNGTPERRGKFNGPIRLFFERADGGVWCVTRDSLVQLSGGSLKSFGQAEGLAGSPIGAVAETPDGVLLGRGAEWATAISVGKIRTRRAQRTALPAR